MWGAGSPPPEGTGMSFSNLEHGRMMRPMALNGHPLQNAPTRRIIATSVLIFVCYCTIGLQLAVVPGFVHLHLGYCDFSRDVAEIFSHILAAPLRLSLR